MSARQKLIRLVLVLSVAAHLVWGVSQSGGACAAPSTIQACNRGYPFHFYTGDPADTQTDPKLVRSFLTDFMDYGLSFLLSVQGAVTQALTGSPPTLRSTDELRVLDLALILTALAACLSPTPFPVAVGAVLGLHLLIPMVFLDQRGIDFRAWGGLAAFQCALFLAIGLQPRRGRIGWACLVVLGLMIGYSPMMRQSCQAISLGLLLTLGLVLGALLLVVLRPPGRDRAGAWRVCRGPCGRAVLCLLLLASGLVLVRYAVLAVYARAYAIPLSRLEMPQHGSGFPLYLSLGEVSNPYNIAWADEIAVAHGQLAAGGPLPYDTRLQKQLVKEWQRLVREAPDMFLANVLSRAQDLGRLIFVSAPGTQENRLWREVNPWRARGLPVLFVAAVIALVAMLVRFMRRPSLVAGLYLAGALGAVLGANASALLIYTGYPWDTCGSLLTLVFVVLPAFWCFAARGPALSSAESDRELERNLMRRLTVGLVSLLVLALAGGGVWAVHCHFRNLRIAEWVAARPDPLADIHANGYRYVAFFNRMSDASQERILEKLKDSGEPGVFCFAAGMGRLEIFRPEVAVVADGNLYLVCRFNEGWQPPAQFFDQGARNSYVHVVRDADEVLGRWPFQMDRGTAGFHRINDRFWENRYRMLCLPCGAGFQPRASVGVGCFTIVGETSKGWELESVAEGTLTLPAPLPQARAEDSGRADTCAP